MATATDYFSVHQLIDKPTNRSGVTSTFTQVLDLSTILRYMYLLGYFHSIIMLLYISAPLHF